MISVWRLANLAYNVLPACLQAGPPAVFAVSDNWVQDTQRESWMWSSLWNTSPNRNWRSSAKRLVESIVRSSLAETQIRFDTIENVHFFSKFIQKGWETINLRPSSSVVIHHGVHLNTYRFKEQMGPEARKILFVGRLDSVKGVHVLIDAMDLLARRSEVTGLELDIIGEDLGQTYRRSLEDQVQKLGLCDRVRLLGGRTREQTAQAYADYDLLVFPSIWEEPFSIALIEAMACGLPVVATNTGGTPEIVRDGESGLLVPPDDPRDGRRHLPAHDRPRLKDATPGRGPSFGRGDVRFRFDNESDREILSSVRWLSGDSMRIAVWHNLLSGGAKRALHDHVRGLVMRGHHVESWSPHLPRICPICH